jgi:hypothetical protein
VAHLYLCQGLDLDLCQGLLECQWVLPRAHRQALVPLPVCLVQCPIVDPLGLQIIVDRSHRPVTFNRHPVTSMGLADLVCQIRHQIVGPQDPHRVIL